jgi:hypothetical protein
VTGRKRFLNQDNEIEGTLNQPLILADSEVIDSTEISFLAGVTSNIQTQFAGINVVLTGLTALEQALQAIEPSPASNVVKFDDTILLTDGVRSSTLTKNSLNVTSTLSGTSNPFTSLNMITAGGGSLVEDVYNQRTAITGEFTRKSFFAKASSGAKTEYARISVHSPNIQTNNQRGRLDLECISGSTVEAFVSCNANTQHVDIKKTLHLNGQIITNVPNIYTNNSNTYGKNAVLFCAGNTTIPQNTPEDNLRLTLINVGVPDVISPISGTFPGQWGLIQCSANFNGFTYVGTNNGYIYYSSDGNTWYGINDTFNGGVYCMVEYNGGLIVGGDFSQTGSGLNTLNSIARVDTSSNVSQITWNNYGSVGLNAGAVIRSFCTYNGYLYMAGKFDYDGNYSLNCRNVAVADSSFNLFCVDNSSGTGYGPDAQVYFIHADQANPNYFILGGEFTNFFSAVGSVSTNRNAIWHTNGGYDSVAQPYEVVYMDNPAVSIAQNGSDVYIGGYFTGLPYGNYLTTFSWNGTTYSVSSNPYGASPSSPIQFVYQGNGIFWADNSGALYEANSLVGYPPQGGAFIWIFNTIWGQVLFSSNSGSQDPVVAYYALTSDTITLTMSGGYTIYSGSTPYTGGVVLNAKGSVVEMIYQAATASWFVLIANNASFFN